MAKYFNEIQPRVIKAENGVMFQAAYRVVVVDEDNNFINANKIYMDGMEYTFKANNVDYIIDRVIKDFGNVKIEVQSRYMSGLRHELVYATRE